MKAKEKIQVYIDVIKGKTVCICKAEQKRCGKDCILDTVERDRYAEWQETFRRDQYGR